MIDIFYRINNFTFHSKWKTFLLFRLTRLMVRLAANLILPIYYSFTTSKNKCQPSDRKIIVSFTSYPARINKVWLVIETMFHQTLKPNKIILWLSKDQFPGGISDLPKRLVSQKERGLDIKFVDGDIRSHKKYYYSFKEFPNDVIFLIDDDIFYPSNLLLNSYTLLHDNPNSIVANFGFEFVWDNRIGYISIVSDADMPTRKKSFFFGTGGGTMLPPSRINHFIDPIEKIITLCPTADDIYLNGITRISKMNVIVASNNPLITISGGWSSLLSENGAVGNPNSCNAKQMQAMINHCEIKYGVNPFLV